MAQFDTWESYFYPETFDPVIREGTLRNLYGETDPMVLAKLEYIETTVRATQITAGEVTIPKTYDGEHLRALHRHLLQDVYEWAGEYRTVDISKPPGREFGRVETGELSQYLADVHQLVTGTNWDRLDRPKFVEQAATVFAYVNQAHPFREGNGRTSKLFMLDVAEQSRFTFDFARVTPEVWNQGSAFSRPDLYAYKPEPESLLPVFEAITVERRPEAKPQLEQGHSLLRASYPQPATDAARAKGAAQARPRTAGSRPANRGYGTEQDGR